MDEIKICNGDTMLYVVKLLYIELAIDVFAFNPSAEAVRTSTIGIKEYLGILAVKLGVQ